MTAPNQEDFPLLTRVKNPRDLNYLTSTELVDLADEIRTFLIRAVAKTGGHLGPNLGVVELTLALHRVFDSPTDTIIWDTGHQAYVHKLLTGRQDFTDLRAEGGLSGYPDRAESAHDVVENSHASTALSWADGVSLEKARAGGEGATIAVIGDGALTGGMAWEALNSIARDQDPRPLIMVVNDNGRSYAPTVGGLAHHLDALRTSTQYEETLERGKQTLLGMGDMGKRAYDALHGLKTGLKDVLAPQVLFEDLGIKYMGPIDGHDQVALELALERARTFAFPVLVHVITQKGRGYVPAETDLADRFHAVGQIHPETGLPVAPQRFGWTKVFAEELVRLASADTSMVGLTAAMMAPVGLQPMATAFPDRVFDVGIAEQHAFTTAAGMAYAGAHPVVCVYATFMNRAFDQLLLDVALHDAPVTIALDRAGITGDDGPSHNGMWDLSLAAMVPGLKVCAPRDSATLRRGLAEAVADKEGPTLVRYPKGEPGPDLIPLRSQGVVDVMFEGGQAGKRILIAVAGPLVEEAIAAAEELVAEGQQVTVVNPRWVLPISEDLLEIAYGFDVIVSVEDGLVTGGVGSEIARLAAERDLPAVTVLGVPKQFVSHGKRPKLLADFGLDRDGIATAARKRVASTVDA